MDEPRAAGVSYSDPSSLFILFITLCGFLIPMVIIYPPVFPRPSDFLRETHNKLGPEPGPETRSIKGRSAPAEGAPSRTAAGEKPQIQSLWIYPVKSCRGIQVTRSKVLPTGLEFDRLFTFAQLRGAFPVGLDSSDDEKNRCSWHFITQRQFPMLATVDVELWQPDVAKSQRKGSKISESFIVVRFPWRDDGLRGFLSWIAAKLVRGLRGQPEKEFVLPVEFPSQREMDERGYTREDVAIWRDSVTAVNMEVELPPELRLYLGVSNKLGLFRIDPAELRQIHRCAPTQDEAGYQPVTGFQDAYPLHLISLSSIQDLDSKLRKDDALQHLDPQRFRANVITAGSPAYDEDSWKTIRFSPATPSSSSSAPASSTFHVSCRTVRCTLPNVDPATGSRHPAEPDQSLRALRDIDEGAPNKGCLGMQLTPLFDKTDRPENMEITLEVGMSIDVMERGPHRYIAI